MKRSDDKEEVDQTSSLLPGLFRENDSRNNLTLRGVDTALLFCLRVFLVTVTQPSLSVFFSFAGSKFPVPSDRLSSPTAGAATSMVQPTTGDTDVVNEEDINSSSSPLGMHREVSRTLLRLIIH